MSGIALTSGNFDAFGRLRVSNPVTLFSSQLQYDTEPLQYEAFATGAGVLATHDADTRMASMTVNAGGEGGTSGMQSYAYIPYQAGKSHAGFITAVFGPPTTGAVKRVGYYDDANGVFLQQNGDGTVQTVLRSSTSGAIVDRIIPQSDFVNLSNVDGFDKGRVSNFQGAEIFHFDLQFLGMGRVRTAVDIDGDLFYLSEYMNADNLTVPYMQSGTLPVRCEVIAAGTLAAPATLQFKCAEVRSEGGALEDFAYAFSTEVTGTAGNNTPVHFGSIRAAATFNGIPNRMQFSFDTLDVFVSGTNTVKWEVCIGSTFTVAPTYAAYNANVSGVEVGTGGTVLDKGIVVGSGYTTASAATKSTSTRAFSQRYPIALNKAGGQYLYGQRHIFLTGISGTSAARASFSWREFR